MARAEPEFQILLRDEKFGIDMDTLEAIVCTSCGAVNRAPGARLQAGARPTCGSCRRPLFSGEPYDIGSAAEFDRLIAKTSVPVLVDFWAPLCGPSKMMADHKLEQARFKLE